MESTATPMDATIGADRNQGEAVRCVICGFVDRGDSRAAFGEVRGNTQRFLGRKFALWKCPGCQSIHSLEPVDFADIYADYPLNRRRLDIFARGTFKNLLGRLVDAGLKRTDSILDYGCGNGLFVQYLLERGYAQVQGYDPFVPDYAALDVDSRFDCVVANDVIEHVPDPRLLIGKCAALCKPGGLMYIGTADSEPVQMDDLEPHIMRLHQPFHRVILTQAGLLQLAGETGMELVASYRRSYMDTWWPFSNYRFLDEFNGVLGHNMDRAFEPSAGTIVARRPVLLLYAFAGYLVPSAYEPAVTMRKPPSL